MKILKTNFVNELLTVHSMDKLYREDKDEFICNDGFVSEIKYGCCIYKED